jgi:hypothetical protein
VKPITSSVVMNACAWMKRLEAAAESAPNQDAAAAAQAWATYIQTVTLNLAVNAEAAGLAPPLVPVEAALAQAEGR